MLGNTSGIKMFPNNAKNGRYFPANPPKSNDVLGADKNREIRHNNVMSLSIEEAAKCLGISRSSLYRLLDRQEIRSFHINHRHLISMAALTDYVSNREEEEYDKQKKS